MSFVIADLSKFAYFVEHNISYQPCKFQLSTMFGSNFTEGGGKHTLPPPQCCTGRKKPSAFRVKLAQDAINVKSLMLLLSLSLSLKGPKTLDEIRGGFSYGKMVGVLVVSFFFGI